MAFFDIGINVTITGLDVANTQINGLKTSLASIPSAAQNTATAVTNMNNSFRQTSVAAGQAVSAEQNIANGMRAMFPVIESNKTGIQQFGLTVSNMVQPMNQASVATEKFSATLNQIKATNLGPLNQIPSQLGQTATAMDRTTASGNRLAEIFRGNRGLVFGFSAFIGTLTGIGFELQLVDDANKQVAESQARLNELVAQGREGSAQYSQAQQALAKDQRFLEFSSRNLALAFTNLLPDLILITNGILGLKEKMGPASSAMTGLSGVVKTTGTELQTMGVAAASGAAPLANLGIGGRAAATGLGEATTAATGFRAILLTIGGPIAIILGVGAAIAALALAFQPLIQNAQKADPVYRRLMGVQDDVGNSAKTLADSMDTASASMEKSVKTMADNITSHYQKLIQDTLKFAQDIKQASQGKVEVLGPPVPEAASRGLLGGTSQAEGGKLSQKDITTITKGNIAPGSGGGEVLGPPKPPPKPPTPMEQFNAMSAQISSQFTTLQTSLRAPGELFSQLPKDIPLTIDMIMQVNDLLTEMTTLMDKASKTPLTPAETLRLVDIKGQITDIITGKKELEKTSKDEAKTQRDLDKAYRDSQQGLDAYNATLDKLPLILQDTGAMTKKVSDEEGIRQGIIRTSAAVFIGYADAQKVSLGVAQQVAEQGNKLTSQLINQRDAIAANNLIWSHMDQIVAGTTQTLGDWILTQQRTILASIDVTQALTNQTKNQYLVNQGMIAGKLAAQSWLEGMIQTRAENAQFVTSATQIANVMGVTLPKNVQLSREEFIKLGQSLVETGGEGQFLADQLNNRIAPAVELLSKAINAKNWKEFKDGFKGLEFGDTSGKLVSKFKDFDNMLRKVNEDAREMNTVFQQMNLMESLGKLDPKTFVKGITEMEDKVKQIAKLQNIDLSTIINFLEEMKQTKDPTQLAKFQNVFALISADAQNGYTSEELRQINDAINKVDPNPIVKLEGALNGMLITTKEFKKLGPLGSIISTGVTPGQEGWASQKEMKNGKWTGRFINTPIDDKNTKISPEQQKLVSELNQTIPAAAAKAQKALADLAVQGSNSLSLLVKNLKPHVQTINTYLAVTVFTAASKAQESLANLAIQGSNSISILVKNLKPHVTTLNTYFSVTVVTAVTNALASIIALQTEGSIQMATMVKNFKPHVTTLNTYFGTTIPNAVAKTSASFEDGVSAAKDYAKALIALAAAAKAAIVQLEKLKSAQGGGGGGSGSGHQHGLHTTLDSDAVLFAHRGERVDIDTVGATQSNQQKARGSGGITVINLAVTTVNELDGQVIGTTVTRKTFRKMSTR